MKKKTVCFITITVMVIIIWLMNDKRSRVKRKEEQHIFSLCSDQIVEFIRFAFHTFEQLTATMSNLGFVQHVSVKTRKSIFCSDTCKSGHGLRVISNIPTISMNKY